MRATTHTIPSAEVFVTHDTGGWWTIRIPNAHLTWPRRPCDRRQGVAKSACARCRVARVELAEGDVNVRVVVADEVTKLSVKVATLRRKVGRFSIVPRRFDAMRSTVSATLVAPSRRPRRPSE